LTVAALVLAAGGGTRWDGPGHKLLTEVRGRPLWSWAVDGAAAAGLDDVFVVVGAVDLPVPADVVLVRNERWREGQATSLAAGIAAAAAAGHDTVVVGLADQPGVTAAAWRAVASASSPMAVAVYDDDRQGHPVRLHSSVWPLLSPHGDEGARAVMRERPDLVGRVACEGDPSDVDTVEDLTAWS
jgi:CTP:molybdopterin cytidylyltransferase MocA